MEMKSPLEAFIRGHGENLTVEEIEYMPDIFEERTFAYRRIFQKGTRGFRVR